MVDRTVYPKDAAPELGLRQLFGKHKVAPDLCLLIAEVGLRSVEQVAVLGDTLASVKATFKTVIRDVDKLGSDDAAKGSALLSVCTVWKSCVVLCDHYALQRAKMAENPNQVPEIAGEDHGEFRQQFVDAHADVVLNAWKEPHRKFVERMNRYYAVHGSVPFYELGEIRVKGETIHQAHGFARSAQDLLQIAKEDVKADCTTEEDAMNPSMPSWWLLST